MPVNEFPGRFGWGYDGVNLFAPTRLYGAPDDLRRFIDRGARAWDRGDPRRGVQPPRARRKLPRLRSPRIISRTATRTSGARPSTSMARTRGPVREFFVANAAYWIDEFHFDGLRLDATQAIFDASDEHVIAADRAGGARRRRVAATSARRRERTAAHAAGAPRRARRLWPRRALERRFPPLRHGGLTGTQRGLLRGSPRRSAGVHRRREVRLSVSGPAVTRWQAKRRGAPGLDLEAVRLRRLPPEPRSDRELRPRDCAAIS